MQNKTNWLAIIAAAVAGSLLGFLWYGQLFQDIWMAGNGITMSEDSVQMFKNGVEMKMSSLPMIINTAAMVIYALVMNWLINKTDATSLVEGAKLGAIIGFLLLMNVYVSNRFAANPTSLSMVDGSYALALFTAMGAIIGGWRK